MDVCYGMGAKIDLFQAVIDLLLVDWSGSASYGGPSGGTGDEFSAGLMVSTAGNDEFSESAPCPIGWVNFRFASLISFIS